MRNNKGQFKGNNTFQKKCQKCNSFFLSKSGSKKYCDNCNFNICPECNTKISTYKTFCNMSCAGKYRYKNSEKVKNVLASGALLSKTPQALKKLSLALKGIPRHNLRGDKNPNWNKGGNRNERHIRMGRVEYLNWRTSVFQRDNYTCQCCGQHSNKLIADHIIPVYLNSEKELDIDNGTTVCYDCNKYLPTTGQSVKTWYKYLLSELTKAGLEDYIKNPIYMKDINFVFAKTSKFGQFS